MMKTVLSAFNARYSHSSLALRYLKAWNSGYPIEMMEFSINDDIRHVYAKLLEQNADLYGFSCYIWNIEPTLKTAELLKKARPECVILLGGPEASYHGEALLAQHPYIDGIIIGEGEEPFSAILSAGLPLVSTDGLLLRDTPYTPQKPLDLSRMPQPYTIEDIRNNRDKILYFETSRGCPFRCSYCLSSAEHSLRYFPIDYVKEGLSALFREKVPLVKLIDRTFNADTKRAAEILRFIRENATETRVHLELEPALLTDELIDLLGTAPKGMFQVEMGMQSTNPETLKAVFREQETEKAFTQIRKLANYKTVPIHLDLIAGLPFETYRRFGKSFDDIFALKPDMLQLGFLKVLHGTGIANRDDIIAAGFPPYEVISTRWLTASEICILKDTETAVDLFYNSGAFSNTVATLTENAGSAFQIFTDLGILAKAHLQKGSRKRSDWYEILYQAYGDMLRDALTEDFIRHNKGIRLPDFCNPKREHGFKDKVYRLLKSEDFCNRYHIHPNPAQIRFERINGKAVMMDYEHHQLYDISAECD